MKTDIVIVGCGVSGLYCALSLPSDKKITLVTKAKADKSDSYLAQGGICVLRGEEDYDSYFEDTMRAGRYENDPHAVDIMIRSSQKVIDDLVKCGVDFERNFESGEFVYTREGAHSSPRILFHADETGKEITSKLLETVRKLPNVNIIENFTVVDILESGDQCCGITGHDENNVYTNIFADYTVLATGGIGGLYAHSTNYSHLTGDALAIAINHGVELKNIDYIQIHPTTLYTEKSGREFLISESVRGEGAMLLNAEGERFVNELLPRDVLVNAIYEQMKKDNAPHVWLSMAPIPTDEIKSHFPHIYEHCLAEGYDPTLEAIPVVPSQHYYMGGIKVNEFSKTSMERLYAVGETACNGVHGKNRLACNSLLESLVFARCAASDICATYSECVADVTQVPDPRKYDNYREKYKKTILAAIEKARTSRK